MSSAPTTRSSVAPSGRSTTGTATRVDLRTPPAAAADAQVSQACATAIGSHPYGQPRTTRILGSSAASERTAVDLPVPRSPNTSTPPMLGSTAAIRIASFMSS